MLVRLGMSSSTPAFSSRSSDSHLRRPLRPLKGTTCAVTGLAFSTLELSNADGLGLVQSMGKQGANECAWYLVEVTDR